MPELPWPGQRLEQGQESVGDGLLLVLANGLGNAGEDGKSIGAALVLEHCDTLRAMTAGQRIRSARITHSVAVAANIVIALASLIGRVHTGAQRTQQYGKFSIVQLVVPVPSPQPGSGGMSRMESLGQVAEMLFDVEAVDCWSAPRLRFPETATGDPGPAAYRFRSAGVHDKKVVEAWPAKPPPFDHPLLLDQQSDQFLTSQFFLIGPANWCTSSVLRARKKFVLPSTPIRRQRLVR